jgi:hypothetical protein
MIKEFKFFEKNLSQSRKWLYQNYYAALGQLHWMYHPVGTIFYNEITDDGNGGITEEIKTTTVQIYSRYIHSYNHFMEMNRDKVIFVYEFVDNANISNMITYKQDNFDDMPKDRPIIFRGVIRNNEIV